MTKQECTDRERVCAMLQALGVDARLAPRGAPEERWPGIFGGDWNSRGLIMIEHSPISWLNVVEDNDGWFDRIQYWIRDRRQLPHIRLEPVKKDSGRFSAEVVGVQWKVSGRDKVAGINFAHSLTLDQSIQSYIMQCNNVHGNLVCEPIVESRPKYSSLVIDPLSKFWPTAEQWACYERIANHLLQEILDIDSPRG
jgi:hypothetical protein